MRRYDEQRKQQLDAERVKLEELKRLAERRAAEEEVW
jgi:hypothetical protein